MGNTDWQRLRVMTDEEAYLAACADSDNPPLEDMDKAIVIRMRDVPGTTIAEKIRQLRENQPCIGSKFGAYLP